MKGDLQMHTTASDGKNSIEEMAEAARELGHEYIAITDHSKAVTVANGLDENAWKRTSRNCTLRMTKSWGFRCWPGPKWTS